jgi:hypothetical protein
MIESGIADCGRRFDCIAESWVNDRLSGGDPSGSSQSAISNQQSAID